MHRTVEVLPFQQYENHNSHSNPLRKICLTYQLTCPTNKEETALQKIEEDYCYIQEIILPF